MPKIKYENLNIGPERMAVIAKANEIIAEYEAQGFDLTLRQLYYQFVARGLIANKLAEYKKLGNIIADGRLAGLIDWEAISDRTRNLRSLSCWSSPQHILNAVAQQFRLNCWDDQDTYVEVWIEKDALIGVIEPICNELRVPFFSCRGYTSLSEVWGAAMRFAGKHKPIRIVHLGDHDPSGIDMTRDIEDRLTDTFRVDDLEVIRVALNMDQVEQYDPPPNPAKITDSRATKYIAKHGDESWELDALDPRVIAQLISKAVLEVRDDATWIDAIGRENSHKKDLGLCAEKWDKVIKTLRK